MKKLLILLVLFAVVLPGTLLFISNGTTLRLDPPVKVIGVLTPVEVEITNPHGIRRITGFIEQDGTRLAVFDFSEPAQRFLFWKERRRPRRMTFEVGQKVAPSLHDGKARLIIEAQSNDMRGSTDDLDTDIQIILAPPQVKADGAQHYINQGGSELVTFTASGYWTEAGVRAGPHTFRSFALPGRPPGERFALFAYAWDLPEGIDPKVFIRNPAGAEATAGFWHKVFPKKFHARDLAIDDAFLQKVVGQIDPQGSGDLLERFLRINRDMRQRNNQVLASLTLKTADHFLWSGPFLQMMNTQVESSFADKRSYIYKGKKVDEQVHLGFDLASTQHVAVPAANDGKIVYAADLGIYGNCVVVDHGYGLQSIYGHLSEIAVKPGDMVKKGQALGKSGSTGLAGGDHLHFSMQVDGVQVNPVEWWDEHWIKDRILSKVGGGS